MEINVSRRGFFRGLTGLLATPAVAVVAQRPDLASSTLAEIVASAPKTAMWAAGTPGDFNWRPIAAESAEEAFGIWCDQENIPVSERPRFFEGCAKRMTAWDGMEIEDIAPSDWLNGGLGHHCERCDGEVSADCGRVIAGDVVCFECMTYGESLAEDRERGMEEIVNLILNEGEDEARDFVVMHEDFDLIGEEVWSAAAARAREAP